MKKGFTLTELLAVIVIISIIIIIMFPSYIDTSDSIKNSNLENIKSILSKSMLDYANKNYIDDIKPAANDCTNPSKPCCMYFSISFIKAKEIFQTANGNIINPVTNEDLSGYIKVEYNTNKYVLVSSYEPDLGNCGKCKYVTVDEEQGQEITGECS